MTDYALRYDSLLRPLFGVLGLSPGQARIAVDETHLHVRMGWAFRADVPLPTIVSVRRDSGPVLGWGVHGWGGSYLVNASSDGIVRVDLVPSGRAWLMGVPVQLRKLRLSLEEPDAFVAELGRAAAG